MKLLTIELARRLDTKNVILDLLRQSIKQKRRGEANGFQKKG